MDWKRGAIPVFLLAGIFCIAIVSGAPLPSYPKSGGGLGDIFGQLGDMITQVLDFIIKIFNFTFLKSQSDTLAFGRFLFAVMIFAIVYGVLSFLKKSGSLEWLSSGIIITLAIVISVISVLFMPDSVVSLVAYQWGDLGRALLMFPLFLAGGWLAFKGSNHWLKAFGSILLVVACSITVAQ